MPAMADLTELSSRERQIMDVVYRLGEATARQIGDELPDPLANATIRTLVRILESKGYLTHREEGRQFVFRPTRAKQKVAESAIRRLVGVFFEGSVSQAVSGMIESKDLKLSDDELAELSRLIERARAERKEKGS